MKHKNASEQGAIEHKAEVFVVRKCCNGYSRLKVDESGEEPVNNWRYKISQSISCEKIAHTRWCLFSCFDRVEAFWLWIVLPGELQLQWFYEFIGIWAGDGYVGKIIMIVICIFIMHMSHAYMHMQHPMHICKTFPNRSLYTIVCRSDFYRFLYWCEYIWFFMLKEEMLTI